MTRLAITGGPKTGKTTLAGQLAEGCRVIRTDDYIDKAEGWSAGSLAIASDLVDLHNTGRLDWIIEGVALPRALRKVRDLLPGHRVIDRLIVLHNPPFEDWTAGQASMAKGLHSVLAEIRPWLVGLGVDIEDRR